MGSILDEWERGPAIAEAQLDLPEAFEIVEPAEAPIFAMDRVDRQIARHVPRSPHTPARYSFKT